MSTLLLADVDTLLADLEAEFAGHVLVAGISRIEYDDTHGCTYTCPCDDDI